MKRVLIFFILFILCSGGYGQKPESFLYQVSIRNNRGEIIPSRLVSFRLSILSGNPSGPVVFAETQTTTTNRDGIASLSVGNGSDKISSVSAIDWNASAYFIKVEADTSGGENYRHLFTTELLNIPFEEQKKSSRRMGEIVIEDQFLMTRKYVGQYMEYRHTGSETSSGPNIIWIKTSLDKTYGKLSAYGKTCDFNAGDKLYVRRIFYSPGDVTGYWVYQIENDASVYYRLSEFQYDKKVFVETLFKQ